MKKMLTGALLSATILGAGLAVSSNASAADLAQGAKTDATVSFKAGDGTKPIDPVDPTKPPVDPDNPGTGNTGNLAIVYASQKIDFGTNFEIPTKEMTYETKKTVSLEVGDVRGTNAGWALSVKAPEFKSGTDVLTGAQIVIDASDDVSVHEAPVGTVTAVSKGVTVGADASVMLSAAKGTGSGITIDNLAAGKIKLVVPAGIAKAQAYSTTMNWTLSDVPA